MEYTSEGLYLKQWIHAFANFLHTLSKYVDTRIVLFFQDVFIAETFDLIYVVNFLDFKVLE